MGEEVSGEEITEALALEEERKLKILESAKREEEMKQRGIKVNKHVTNSDFLDLDHLQKAKPRKRK